ncbi:DUF3429 domain-containing protein [Simiduia agarivorans]|uniref:DUF3429 domain-containing protein n=1 Tax=Simiduia agarivorans (strain DSM 21679 / JCM 13881 / BCRC 17597 / SA1) TaxID=1117647 RepID=K4KQH8_SIMAS|nr:DUF3429 domain-containing protein [Simiduia agarivorans]AFV00374.1 hypothetical protein M5M_16205 [Simiduia agarivorans SA1 = DSM 21679]
MNQSTPFSPSRTVAALTLAGILPFLGLGLLHTLMPDWQPLGISPLSWLAGYSLAIASFMAGTLWRPDQAPGVLIGSNLLTLCAWVLGVWQPVLWPMGMALIFGAIYLTERQVLKRTENYLRLRRRATGTVIACLLGVQLTVLP